MYSMYCILYVYVQNMQTSNHYQDTLNETMTTEAMQRLQSNCSPTPKMESLKHAHDNQPLYDVQEYMWPVTVGTQIRYEIFITIYTQVPLQQQRKHNKFKSPDADYNSKRSEGCMVSIECRSYRPSSIITELYDMVCKVCMQCQLHNKLVSCHALSACRDHSASD